MKLSSLRASFRHLLALGALVTSGLLLTACTVEQPDDDDDADSEVNQSVDVTPEAPICCQKVGYVYCPDNGNEWVYFPLGWCGPLRSSALSNCNNACVAACVDQGYFNECL